MQAMTTSSKGKWTTQKANEHQREMNAILQKDLTKYATQEVQTTP